MATLNISDYEAQIGKEILLNRPKPPQLAYVAYFFRKNIRKEESDKIKPADTDAAAAATTI